MNTIPLTLDSYRPNYTVLGGTPGASCTDGLPISILLLNRGPRLYRANVIQELVQAGFDSIISMEGDGDTPELESIVSRFPHVRFICLHEEGNIGLMINIGMREACSPYVFVLWNDVRLGSSTLSSRFFDKVLDLDIACLVPCLNDSGGSIVPSISHPANAGKAFKVVPLPPKADGEKCLYPFDVCGIYSRQKFTMLGGFDCSIQNPYWQKLDFGIRTWLWGECIRYAQALKLNYDRMSPADDTSPDGDYGRFWLKNLAPVFYDDAASLPRSKFWSYLARSRKGPVAALEEFKEARAWVEACSYRFKQDATRLANLWDPLS